MKFTASQIAELLNGEIVGDQNVEVSNLSKIEEGKSGSLTFLSNPKYMYLFIIEKVNYTNQKDIDIIETVYNAIMP